MKRVLLVNGINTHKGGAAFQSLKHWKAVLSARSQCQVWHFTPETLSQGSPAVYKAYLALIFLPGTLFRVFRFPFFELINKVSFVQSAHFLIRLVMFRPHRVILSHHATFHLSWLVPRSRRVLIIHDLLYVRARSMGYSRRLSRLLLGIELFVYGSAPTVLISSTQETRLLSFLLRNRSDTQVKTISSYRFPEVIAPPESPSVSTASIALIADWRRFENIDGVKSFFLSHAPASLRSDRVLTINIWGFNSEKIEQILSRFDSPSIRVVNRGAFDRFSDVTDPFILAPIFVGAGIKMKVLEAIAHGKGVIGTNAAFIGIPPKLLKGVALRIKTVDDLIRAPLTAPTGRDFEKFSRGYSQNFEDIFSALQLEAATESPA